MLANAFAKPLYELAISQGEDVLKIYKDLYGILTAGKFFRGFVRCMLSATGNHRIRRNIEAIREMNE
jgi:hypothetical protein